LSTFQIVNSKDYLKNKVMQISCNRWLHNAKEAKAANLEIDDSVLLNYYDLLMKSPIKQ